jgi:hypothetical protein
MISLGKKEVLFETIENGRAIMSIIERRTIYEKKDGTFWVKTS